MYAEGRTPSVTSLDFGATAASAIGGVLYYLPVGSTELRAMYTAAPALPYRYKTFEAEAQFPTWWTTFYLTGEGSDVTVKLYVDDKVVMNRTVPMNKLIRIPRHRAGYKVAIELTGTATINNVVLATTGTQNVSTNG
jgi:hypothetical protein